MSDKGKVLSDNADAREAARQANEAVRTSMYGDYEQSEPYSLFSDLREGFAMLGLSSQKQNKNKKPFWCSYEDFKSHPADRAEIFQDMMKLEAGQDHLAEAMAELGEEDLESRLKLWALAKKYIESME